MKVQEMKEKAKLFKETLEIKNQKPKLIAESQQKINQLKAEIEELEKDGAKQALNQSFSKLNPKKFFFKSAEVNVDELILQKELEIRKEERSINALEKAKVTEVVDLEAVVKEGADILQGQRKVLEKIKGEILETQSKYHSLLDQYNEELKQYNAFAHTVNANIVDMKKENFTPRYSGEQPSGDGRLSTLSMDNEIIRSHRMRPDREGNLHS